MEINARPSKELITSYILLLIFKKPLISQGFSAFVPFSGTVMEAPPRIELGNKGFADLCLTARLWGRNKF